MRLATQTRPGIPDPVREVARHCSAPKYVHWRAALGILGYLRRTSRFGIAFQRGTVGGLSLQVFADADYASVAADRRSVSGGLVMMCGGMCLGCLGHRRSASKRSLQRRQSTWRLQIDVMQEVLFLWQVRRFMLLAVGTPCMPVFEDKEGAVL